MSENKILISSYNVDTKQNIVERDINIQEYDLKNHTNRFFYQIKNTRMNFIEFIKYGIPFIHTPDNSKEILYSHNWNKTNYSIKRTILENEKTIFIRNSLPKDHFIGFILADSRQNNKILHYFQSSDQFECNTFEIIQYDIHSGTIQKVAEGKGSLYSTPYFETKGYLYIEARENNQVRKMYCFKKPAFQLEKIVPIEMQTLVGCDYDSDTLTTYDPNTFTFSLWVGSQRTESFSCSSLPYEVNNVTIKVYQERIILLAIIEESFDSGTRYLRWIEFNANTKQTKEKNWNEDSRFRYDRGGYKSDKNDYYILAYEKKTRKVVFGIINLVKGTIYYRETDHMIPKDLDLKSSLYLNDKYCFWTEGTTFKEESVTSEKQTFNPMAYYCSLEEPLLQKLEK